MRSLVLFLAAALLAGSPLLAQPALTGPEVFLGPANQMADLAGMATATETTGRVLVVWIESLRGQNRLHGRVFGASGRPEQPAFTLDTGEHPVVDATLAPAAPNGFLLTWRSSEKIGQAERLWFFARRLSPLGRPRGEVIQIRDSLLTLRGFPTVGSVRTASAPDGSFVAIWDETRRSTRRTDVLFRRFDAAGRPVAKPALLPTEGANRERAVSALAVLDDGEIRIAWRSRTAGAERSTLWARRFNRSVTPLAAPVRLLPDRPYAWDSSVAFGPDGGCLAAWGDRARAFAPDGTPLSAPQATASFWRPQVTAERGGTFLVSAGTIGLQLEAGGTPRGPVGLLAPPSAGDEVYGASITGTADGGFALFWSERGRNGKPGRPRLFSQFLATASPGTLQIERARSTVPENASGPLELRILRRDGTAGTVSVRVQRTGAAAGGQTVTFPDGDSTPRTVSIPVSDDAIPGNDRLVRVALLRPTGGAGLGLPRRAVVEVRDDDKPSPLLAQAGPRIEVAYGDGRDTHLWEPDLAVGPGGGFEVVWGYTFRHRYTDPLRYNYAVQGQRFDAAALPLTAFDNSSGDPERIRVAMHPAGDFLVCWEDGDLGFSQRFDALGAAAGPEIYLRFPADDVAPLPNGSFVAVGRGQDAAGEGLFLLFLSTDTVELLPPVPVTREVLEPGSAATVATDAAGRSLVVWSAAPTGDGPAGLFARRFDALGAPLGPVLRVSQWEGHDVAPSVAMDPRGNFAVTWQRSWDGDGTGVYARVFNAAGAPLGEEIPVNSSREGNQEAPSVALTGDGRFAVLWQTSPVVAFWESQVVGQLFARDETRLGSEAQIEPAGYVPVVAWSDQGFFVTAYVWGDASIAARRLPLGKSTNPQAARTSSSSR